MAISLAWRIAVVLAPVVGPRATRVARWAEGPGVSTATNVWQRFIDPAESDEDLSTLLTTTRGTLTEVATYNDPFELRKVHMIFEALDAAIGGDDSRICTFHLAKVAGGVVDPDWDGTDFTALDARFVTFWNAISGIYGSTVKFDRLKVYKAGPAIVPPQVPVYDADKDLAGISTDAQMPPQVAISVTEQAGSKLNWGRFFLPAPGVTASDTYGRWDGSLLTTIANAVDVLYEGLKTDGLHPVVYREELPEREKKNGAVLPARAATAWDVEQIQVDDVADVIRSRRWKQPLLRVQRAIA